MIRQVLCAAVFRDQGKRCQRRMSGSLGSQFAADNGHRAGQPVTKMMVAPNLGAFQPRCTRRKAPGLEPAQGDVAGESFQWLGRCKWPHRLVHPPV